MEMEVHEDSRHMTRFLYFYYQLLREILILMTLSDFLGFIDLKSYDIIVVYDMQI